MYRTRKRPGDARQVLTEALAGNPDDKNLHAELARYYLAEGFEDDKLIENHFRRAYSTGDVNYEARFELAQFLFVRGQMAKAAELFEEDPTQKLRRLSNGREVERTCSQS